MFKSSLLSALFFVCAYAVTAQVSMLPYQESFETPFAESPAGCSKDSCRIEFIPSWWGNDVQASSRIYADTNAYRGARSLGLIPLSSFNPEIVLRLLPSPETAIALDFYATGNKNGSEKDIRPSVLLVAFSIDSGATYVNEMLVDTFQNVKLFAYKPYHFSFEQEAGAKGIWIRLRGIRGSVGTGLAARILVDDVVVQNTVISSVKYKEERNPLRIEKYENGLIYFNRRVSGTLYNSRGENILTLNNVHTFDQHQVLEGLYIFKEEKGNILKISAAD